MVERTKGNKNYRSGRRIEYNIMNDLKKKGWAVVRSAGSHGRWDLTALNPKSGRQLLIQCKPLSMSINAKQKLENENSFLERNYYAEFKVVSNTKELFNEDNEEE